MSITLRKCSKSGTYSVPANVTPGRGTNRLKTGTSRRKRDGWQVGNPTPWLRHYRGPLTVLDPVHKPTYTSIDKPAVFSVKCLVNAAWQRSPQMIRLPAR